METSPLLGRASCQSKIPSAWHDFIDLSSMAAQVSMATLARAALLAVDSVFLGHMGIKELAAASLAQLWTTPALYAVWASASALNTVCLHVFLELIHGSQTYCLGSCVASHGVQAIESLQAFGCNLDL